MSLVQLHGGAALIRRLAAAGLPGELFDWSEALCEGPTPGGVSDDEWYAVRASHLMPGGDTAAIAADLRGQDQRVRALPDDAEIVLWVGPELFCQVTMVRLLTLLSERPRRGAIALVDPGDLPDRRGCTVGKLRDDELLPAFASRRLIDETALAFARQAWSAWTAPRPEPLLTVRERPHPELPYLSDAILRHLENLPHLSDGLSRSERLVLETIAEGVADERALFEAVAAREARPFLVDTALDRLLRRLSAPSWPLVQRTELKLTPLGRAVLGGTLAWNPPDRWHAGLRLAAATPWRWDPARATVVQRS